MLRKLLIGSILTIVVSFYFFPISFVFLPVGLNSKIMLAALGIAAFIFNCMRKGSVELSHYTIVSAVLAIIFSVWCFFSITVNDNYNDAYATYIVSYLTWMGGAYGVYFCLSLAYESVDLDILTRYLAIVGVFQCVSAILIDNVPAFSDFVDTFMYQADNYYKVNHRMYGIGAALDPAGVRFSTILVLIAHQFATNPRVRGRDLYQATLLLAFAVITVIGCVISRTTMIGTGMGVAYILISIIRLRRGGFVTTKMVRNFFIFSLVLVVLIASGIYLYRTSKPFEGYLRFGFEAFFNWAETGEFHTGSTDTLSEMWVWPDDLRTWIIGRGTFGVFENDSDIGYCNFILYCGLIGLVLFSVFFLYCHLILNTKFRSFGITSLLFIVLTFVIWLKVTTDIFFISALLFCIEGDYETEPA